MIDAPSLQVADDVRVVKHLRIPMRDGVRLAADVYLPVGNDRAAPGGHGLHPVSQGRGQPRGLPALPRAAAPRLRRSCESTSAAPARRRASRSTSTRLEEQLDGYDAIEWVATQPWCDGHVNMMGISYGGFTALQVATHQPPHLTLDHPGRLHRRPLHGRLPLPRRAAAHVLRHRLVRHADDRVERDAARSRVVARRLGRRLGAPHRRERALPARSGCAHQTDGPYWRNGSVGDGATGSPARRSSSAAGGTATRTRRCGCIAGARGLPKKVLVGPWNHAYPDAAIPGPRIDYLREVVRWLDHWCKRPRHRASWTSRRSSSTCRRSEPPVVGPARRAGRVARGDARGRPRAPRSGSCTLAATGRLRRTMRRARARTRLTVPSRPSGVDGRPLVGRHPVRAARRPAAGRGPLAGLHVRAAGRTPCDPGPGAGGPRRRAASAPVLGFAVSPRRRRAGRLAPISSRRACSTSRAARR